MADDDLDFDLDDFPEGEGRGGGGARSPADPAAGSGDVGRGRWWVWLVLGVALGVAAALLVPRYVAPHLPPTLGGGLVAVEGEVLDKQRESGRLLLTLDSDRGAMLATFRDRISELDLLVGSGDSVTLAVREFRPFVDGPRLIGVRKGEWEGRVPMTVPGDGDGEDAAGEDEPEPAGEDEAGPAGEDEAGDSPARDTAGDGTRGESDAPPDTAGGGDDGPEGSGDDGDRPDDEDDGPARGV